MLARQSLARVRVADAMTAHPHTARGWITVEDFIHRYLLGDRHSAYPVEGPDGSITGLITLTRAVAPDARATTMVRDAAIPLHQVPTAAPHEPLTALLERLTPNTGARVLVVDGGHVVGIITATDIARLIDVGRLDLPRPAAGHPCLTRLDGARVYRPRGPSRLSRGRSAR